MSVESIRHKLAEVFDYHQADVLAGVISDSCEQLVNEVLRREYRWKIGPLKQHSLTVKGRELELDFTGTAQDPSQPHRTIRIIGEARQNLTRRETEKFLRKVEKVRSLFPEELFPVVFAYRFHPEAIQLAEQAGLTRISARGEIERSIPPSPGLSE